MAKLAPKPIERLLSSNPVLLVQLILVLLILVELAAGICAIVPVCLDALSVLEVDEIVATEVAKGFPLQHLCVRVSARLGPNLVVEEADLRVLTLDDTILVETLLAVAIHRVNCPAEAVRPAQFEVSFHRAQHPVLKVGRVDRRVRLRANLALHTVIVAVVATVVREASELNDADKAIHAFSDVVERDELVSVRITHLARPVLDVLQAKIVQRLDDLALLGVIDAIRQQPDVIKVRLTRRLQHVW